MTDDAIRTDDLTKRYGDVLALDGLDLRVETGEAFGFLGPNGAGKTTAIDVLFDFARPTAGRATVLGHDAQAEPMAVRRRASILPQGYDLYARRTGRQHVRFALDSTGGDASVAGLLDRVGLDPADADRPAGEYSTGMAQRLALAMALAGDPDLLVLDEPAAGLDPTGIRELQALVREEVERGTTVFFSSHVLAHVEAVCDRVGILRDGELVAVDTVSNLRETTGLGTRLTLDLDRVPDVDLTRIEGVLGVDATDARLEVRCSRPAAKAAIIERVLDAGATIRDLATSEPTLGDVFAAYTGQDPAAVEGRRPDREGERPDGGTDAEVVA
ncbi:ABC transporter ATP-binding protein [Halorussus halobius]|uniref:ABC transporter ATP-binding protein n=1 Tax=Halorussus halobius TaxID=1710537 RepID=UPI00109207AC|nr:ABC transporter ATP-binding protein [Halorussus halobius]